MRTFDVEGREHLALTVPGDDFDSVEVVESIDGVRGDPSDVPYD